MGNVIERTTVDIATTRITGDETFSDFDEFGRPGRATCLDCTFTLLTYLCCGLQSETDHDGLTNVYGYDALKRRIVQCFSFTSLYLKSCRLAPACVSSEQIRDQIHAFSGKFPPALPINSVGGPL